MNIRINKKISINENELDISFAKSSGPGGQNVNKTNTKVILSWNVSASHSVNEEVKDLLLKKLNLTNDGRLVIHSDKFRSQDRNKHDCIQKFKKFISSALYVAPKRKKTKPTRAAKEKRLKDKKSRSEIKKTRQNIKY
ncbi:MAG: aminoacyl-tRNA hydrolase [Bdellovibrionales bacterium]|nr:aminoacyl-tRNA hydrolase [Bdellovibrionales bacterium]